MDYDFDIIPENNDTEPILVNEIGSAGAKKPKPNFFAVIYEHIETFCFTVVVMLMIFMFIFRYVTVDGTSMIPTLQNSDKLIISSLFHTPETGDIVVLKKNLQHTQSADNLTELKKTNEPLIKRIIAVGGQTVYIDYENWKIYVDGVLFDDSDMVNRPENESIPMKMSENEMFNSEFVVEEGYVFVLGDNRNNSNDSRKYGLFPEDAILGRVVLRVFPFDTFGKVK